MGDSGVNILGGVCCVVGWSIWRALDEVVEGLISNDMDSDGNCRIVVCVSCFRRLHSLSSAPLLILFPILLRMVVSLCGTPALIACVSNSMTILAVLGAKYCRW